MTPPDRNEQSKNVRQAFDRHAELYQQRHMDVRRYHPALDQFCALLPEGPVSVLDLGCGPGNLSRYLVEVRPELCITGVDLSERMIELARVNVPQGRFLVMDARYPGQIGASFDGVMLGFILPYLHPQEARDLFGRVAELLPEGGLLYVATMEGGDDLSGWKGASTGEGPQIFLQYYAADDLTTWLAGSGFDLIDLQRTTYEDHHGDQVTDLMILARKAIHR